MSNYNGWTRTNYFKVNNKEEFDDVILHLDSEDSIEIFNNYKDKNIVGFGCNSDINGFIKDLTIPEDSSDYDLMVSELQNTLPEGEAVVILHVGHQKLNYVNGTASIFTKDKYEHIDLIKIAEEKARELLGDENYTLEF